MRERFKIRLKAPRGSIKLVSLEVIIESGRISGAAEPVVLRSDRLIGGELARHRIGDRVLNRRQFVEGPYKGLRPPAESAASVDQFRVDAQAVAGLTDIAVEDE